MQAENLLDSTWREAQFANKSRLGGECITAPAPGCAPQADGRRFGTVSDVHSTPGRPFAAQARMTLYLR